MFEFDKRAQIPDTEKMIDLMKFYCMYGFNKVSLVNEYIRKGQKIEC